MPSLKNYFFYDEGNCEFIPVKHSKSDIMIFTACLWILNGVVLAGMFITIFSHYVGTPAELALKAENRALVEQFEKTRSTITDLESQITEIATVDNEMYRSVLGLDPLPLQERLQGVGGRDPYSDFDIYSEETSEILRWTAEKLNSLERNISIQKVSFEEIKGYYNENRDRLSNIPAIKPVNGIVLSTYGMRIHPVLRHRRMHEGIDFRSDVGTPVYATGDARVSFAARKGTFGLMVTLDHGFGYETLYAHLSGFADGIRAGTQVKRGDLIGYSGQTGMVQGPHLHYEVHLDGHPVDPIRYIFGNTTPEEYMMYQEIASANPQSMD
ncbi:MAG: M23 family metallopeptidase [Balneolaceae bacterium]